MDQLLTKSDDELLVLIGENVERGNRELFPRLRSAVTKKADALKWIDKQNDFFRRTLCQDARIQIALHASAETELLFEIACEILTTAVTGVHVGALSAYLVKRGINVLCDGYK